MGGPTVWCPSCGDEYVAGSQFCSDCRVALVSERPEGLTPAGGDDAPGLPTGYTEVGSWPHLATVMLLRRLQDAGVSASVLWSDPRSVDRSALAVPLTQAEFADAVIRELPIDDEIPESTVSGYVERIETRLAEIAMLLDGLRDLPDVGSARFELED